MFYSFWALPNIHIAVLAWARKTVLFLKTREQTFCSFLQAYLSLLSKIKRIMQVLIITKAFKKITRQGGFILYLIKLTESRESKSLELRPIS